ncbi:MAG: hypothetical protein HY526_03680 [Betaproteobacteria bacterium]|nr:hypothetical protein [Betaproteobacteria bacterium]
MIRILTAVCVFLAPFLALADVSTSSPPVETDATGLVVFVVLIVGMVGGFFWFIWSKEKNAKKDRPPADARNG